MATWIKALGVVCPTCQAMAHTPCIGVSFGQKPRSLGVANPHQSRIEAGQRRWNQITNPRQVRVRTFR